MKHPRKPSEDFHVEKKKKKINPLVEKDLINREEMSQIGYNSDEWIESSTITQENDSSHHTDQHPFHKRETGILNRALNWMSTVLFGDVDLMLVSFFWMRPSTTELTAGTTVLLK